jgi:autotransporter-associated beta strand protein
MKKMMMKWWNVGAGNFVHRIRRIHRNRECGTGIPAGIFGKNFNHKKHEKTRKTVVFQALEKFPIIGKSVVWFFQSLEKISSVFPIIGNFFARFSNGWKCLWAAVSRSVSAGGTTGTIKFGGESLKYGTGSYIPGCFVCSALIFFGSFLAVNSAMAGGYFNVKYNTPSDSWTASAPTLYAGDWLEAEVWLWPQDDGNLGAQLRYTSNNWSTVDYDGFSRGAVSGNDARYSNQGSAVGGWSSGTVIKMQIQSWGDSFGGDQYSPVLTSTVAALSNPLNTNSAAGSYPATSITLTWDEWNNKNVMVARTTDATPSGDPVQGTGYAAGNTFGDWTVVTGSDDDGTVDATGLQPDTMYYFKFWSENNSYYSAGVGGVSRTTGKPKSRNYSDGADPRQPATLYLGDTGAAGAFGCKSYGNIADSYGAAGWYVRIKKADGDLSSGATEGDSGGTGSSENKTATAPRFTSTGTWYWGMRVDYGDYGDWFYLADQDALTDMDEDGATSTLTVTVNALNNPTPTEAVTNTANPDSKIDVSWSKDAQGHWVMVVRNTADSWTAPSQGTGYSVGNSIGAGTVVFVGQDGTSFTDTGLDSDTTYYYKIYTENNSYYSSGAATVSETTEAVSPKVLWWRNGCNTDYWWNDTEANYPWYRDCDEWHLNRPDKNVCGSWDAYGPNILKFNIDHQNSMLVNGANFPVHQIVFTNGSAARSLTTDAGGALNFQQSGARIENGDDSTMSFAVPINMETDLQINPILGDLTFSDAITNSGNDISVYGVNSKMLTLGGVVSGAGGLSIEEYSKVKISAASTYSGDTEVNAGELWVATGGSLATPRIYVGDATATDVAKIWIETAGTTVDDDITVRGDGDTWSRYIGGLNAGGTVTYSGAITVNKHVFLEATEGGTVEYSGAIGGSADQHIVPTGLGTKRISGLNNYPGNTLIDWGVVAVVDGGTLGSGGHVDLGSDTYTTNSAKLQLNKATGGQVLTNNIVVKNSDNVGEKRTIESLNTAGTATYLGTVTHDNAGDNLRLYVPEGGTLALSNTVSGQGQLWLQQQGTVKLAGNNTYSGGSYLDRGATYLTHNNAAGSGAIYLGADPWMDASPILEIAGGLTIPNNITSRPPNTNVVTIATDSGSGDVTLSGTLYLTKDIEEATDTRVTYVSNNLSSGSIVIDELDLGGGSTGTDNRFIFIDGDVTVKNIINPPVTAHQGLVMRLSPGQSGDLTLDGTNYANFFLDSGSVIWGPNFTLGAGADEFQVGTTDNMQEADKDASLTIEDAGTYNLDVIIGFKTNELGNTGTRQIAATHGAGTVQIGGNVTLSETDSAGKEIVFTNDEEVVFTGTIGASDAGLRKKGSGELSFAGTASYGGDTYVDQGTLQVGSYGGSLGDVYVGETGTGADDAALYVKAGATFEAPLTIEDGAGSRTLGSSDEEEGNPAFFETTISLAKATIFHATSPQTVVFNDATGNITGAGGVTKTGTGWVAFRGNNNYSAATEVNAGILSIEHANGLGQTGNGTTVAGGAALEIRGGITTAAEPLILNGAGAAADPYGALRNVGDANDYAGPVTLASASTIGVNAGTTLTNSGVISGGFALTKVDTGRLILNNANTFSGDLNVNGGYVQLEDDSDAGGTGEINVAAGATLVLGDNQTWANNLNLAGLGVSDGPSVDSIRASTITGDITLSGNAHIRRTDNYLGNLTLNSPIAIDTHTLYLTCEGREIRMDTSSSITGTKTTDDGAIYKTGAGIFQFRPNAGLTGSIILDGGIIEQTLTTMSAGGNFVMRDGTTFRASTDAGRTINKDMIIEGDVTIGGTGDNTVTLNGTMDLNTGVRGINTPCDVLVTDVMSDGGITKTGDGRMTLTANNTYASGTTISEGVLQLGNNTGAGGVLAGSDIVNNSKLTTHRTDNYTISGDISGTGRVEQIGNGDLILSGANTYSGGTAISNGTVQFASDGNLGSAPGAPAENISIANWTTLRSTGADVTLDANRTITLITGGHISPEGAEKTLSVPGKITGTAQLNIAGGGRVNLMGDNDYVGKTEVQQGSLAIGADSNLGTAPGGTEWGYLSFNNNDWNYLYITNTFILDANRGIAMVDGRPFNLSVSEGSTLTYNGIIDGTGNDGSMALIGPGTAVLGGANAFTNVLYLNNGTLDLRNTTDPLDVWWLNVGNDAGSDDATLILGADTVSLDNQVCVRQNDGTKTISGTPAGTVTFGAGVKLQDDAVLHSEAGNTMVFSESVYQDGGTWAVNKTGAGTVQFNGANSHKYLNISNGIVQQGTAADRLPSYCEVDIDSGATLDLNDLGLLVQSVTGGGTVDLGTGLLTINFGYGNQFHGDITGGGGFCKEGAGQVFILSGTNDYVGSTYISNGTLRIFEEVNIGATPGGPTAGSLQFNNGGILQAADTLALTANRGVALTGNAGFDVYGGETMEINGIIAGSGTITKTAEGVLSLDGDNTFTGNATVSAGILRAMHNNALGTADGYTELASGAALEVDGAITSPEPLRVQGTGVADTGAIRNLDDDNTFSAAVTMLDDFNVAVDNAEDTLTLSGQINEASGANSITKTGPGTLTLSGANLVDGTLTISAGKVKAGNNNALNSVGVGKGTTVADGAALDLNGSAIGGEYVTITGTGISSAGALINDSVTAASLSGPVTLGAASSIGGSGDVTYSGTFNGEYTLTKVGAGKHTLTADSDPEFTGKMVVSAGTLGFTTDDNRLGAVPVGVTADQITLNGGTFQLDGATEETVNANRGITLGASGGGVAAVESGTLTINPIIAGADDGDLTKSGAGVVVLAADNTYDGDTTVSAGTLRVGASERVPNSSALSVAGGATFDLANNTETVGSLAGAGAVTLGSGTLISGGLGTSTEYSGVASGTGNFTKTGAGTLTLSGDNTYEGDTTVSAGTLALGAADRIDDVSDLIVANGAVFNMAGNDEKINSISGVAGSSITMGAGDLRIGGVWTTEFAGVISGTGILIHEGLGAGGDEGILTLSGANSYEGGTVISGGLVRVSANNNLGADTGDIWLGAWKSLQFTESFTVSAGRTLIMDDASGGHLKVDDTKTVVYPGVITGGQLNKNGNGRLDLTGVNTHTGGTHLQYGTLAFGADRNFGAVPGGEDVDNIVVTNTEWSTLLMTNDVDANVVLGVNRGVFMATHTLMNVVESGHLTIAGPVNASPNVSLSKYGDGKLTFSQRADITGILCVNEGELEVTSADPLATSWVNIGEDLIANPSPAVQFSIGPGVTLTNNIAIRTNAAQSTGTRTIAMYPEGGSKITGKTDLYTGVDIGVTPAGATLTNAGVMSSLVGDLTVNKVWPGTLVMSATNYFKRFHVLEGTVRSGIDNALWGYTDLIITNTATYDLDTYALSVAVLAGNGNLDLGSGAITITNGYDREFSGTIVGGGTFRKSGDIAVGVGNDMAKLTGANEYSGLTDIDFGTLWIVNQTNLGDGNLAFDNGARLWISDDSEFDASRSVTLTGNGRIDVYTDKTAIFNGGFTGAGNLSISDTGRVTLAGSSDFTGDVTVNSGILRITHANSLGDTAGDTTIEDGAALEIQGVITTAAEALTLNGTGIGSTGAMRNTDDSNEYAGAVTLDTSSSIAVDAAEDTLTLSGIVGDVGDNDSLTKMGAGTLVLSENNTYGGGILISEGTVQVPTVAAAGTAQPLGNMSAGGSPHVTIGSASEEGRLTYTGGNGSTTKNVNFPAGAIGNINVTEGASTLTFGSLSEWTGSGEFHKEGAGTLALDGTKAISGKTFVEAGTLLLDDDDSLGTSPNVDVASGGALALSGTDSRYVIGSNVTIRGTGGGSGALRALSDCVVTARVELAANASIGTLTDYNTDLVLTNTIFGVGALTKVGPGALRLTNGAINTYTGTTTISEGVLAVSRDSSLGTPPVSATPGHLTIDGGELYKQQSGAGSDYSYLAANRGLTIGANHGTVRILGYTYSYAGLIHGSGDMYVDGSGIFVLSGDSSGTYSGDITISNGTVRLTAADVSGGATTVKSGGTLCGYGNVGTLVADGVLAPSNSTLADAKLNCTSLDLNDGAEIKVRVSSSGTVTNSMIMVNGTMSVDQSEQITVDLSYLGDTTNYFRNIPIIYHTDGTHEADPHTNWVVTGAGALGQFMVVRYRETGSGEYYIQGATPDTDITDGMPNAADDLEIQIYADTVEDLSYDLIYYDAISWPSGSGASSINWQKLYSITATGASTVFTNYIGGLNAGYLRFLRVSPMGAWQNTTDKFASKQVYVAKRSVLYPGRNWVSLPGVPQNPTVSNVFGYNLPATGVKGELSTIVYLYDADCTTVTGEIWLASGTPNRWQWGDFGGSGYADEFEMPLGQGFRVDLPGGSARSLALVGELRTNTQSITIGGGGALTFVSVLLPRAMGPDDLGLVFEGGFTGERRPTKSDRLYLWDRQNQRLEDRGYMWYLTSDSSWRWDRVGWPVVSGSAISQDDALVIYTQGDGYTWTNTVYYDAPTSNMDP